jgi:hypothetical protein
MRRIEDHVSDGFIVRLRVPLDAPQIGPPASFCYLTHSRRENAVAMYNG